MVPRIFDWIIQFCSAPVVCHPEQELHLEINMLKFKKYIFTSLRNNKIED